MTEYDFVKLGEDLATALVKAAEEQVNKAAAILDQTKSIADIMRGQVRAQAAQIETMTKRFSEFTDSMREAHGKLNGSQEAVKPKPGSDELKQLRQITADTETRR